MKVVKTILRLLLYAIGSLVLLLLLLAGFTQTQFARDRLRSFALAQLDSLLIADVGLGEITGNLVTGFSVNGISVSSGGDTLLTAEGLSLRYNLFELPRKSISVHNLLLERPVIRLVRRKGGTWNFSDIIRHVPDDSLPTRPFDWTIHLSRLELRDGRFALLDSTKPGPSETVAPGCMDYRHIDLRDLNLALSFEMRPGDFRAGITRLACIANGTPIRLRHLSGDFQVDSSAMLISDMRVVTDSSHLTLSASLRGADVLNGLRLEALRFCPTAVDLDISTLAFSEFGCLIPAVDFLHGTISGSMIATGPFGAVSVRTLDLAFGKSLLRLNGMVSNLHDPDNLSLDVRLNDSQILPDDPLYLLPSFHLPDYRTLGMVRLNLSFQGRPLDFRTRFALESEAGVLGTDSLALRIGGSQTLRYHGTISMNHLDLSRLLDDPAMNSRLNGSVTIDGAGTRLRQFNGSMHAALDSSVFRGLPVTRAVVNVRAQPHTVQGTLEIGVANTTMQLTGQMNDLVEGRPQFSLEGSMASLNLADLLHDDARESDLNLTLNVAGTGNSLSTLAGDFRATLSGSHYRDYAIEDGELHIVLDQTDSLHRKLEITSPVLDASLTGRFDFTYLKHLVAFELQNTRCALADRFSAFDSLLSVAPSDTATLHILRSDLSSSASVLDCAYTIHVSDLHLLSLMLGERRFNGAGTLTGTLVGGYNRLSSTNRIAVTEFFYGDVAAGMLVEGGELMVTALDVTPGLSTTDLDLRLQAGARVLDISSTQLDSVQVDLRIQGPQVSYSARAALHPAGRSIVQGVARLQGDSLRCTVRTLSASYEEYLWNMEDSAVVTITPRELTLYGLGLHRGEETIRASGSLMQGGGVQATISGAGLQLNDLRYLLGESDGGAEERAFDGTLSIEMSVAGTVKRPDFSTTFAADSVAIRGVECGRVDGRLAYVDGLLNVHAYGNTPGGPVHDGPELSIEGTVPLAGGADLPLDEREFDVTVRSFGTPINILDPFLPNFNQMSGLLECDFRIRGKRLNPLYAGTVRLRDCQFLFVPNNMAYRVEGSFEAAGDRIRVVEATVRNVPGDERDGAEGLVHLGGDFLLRNFTPGDFNLTATGQLHVIKEATRKSALSMYGDLFAEMGPRGLHFTGDISHSLLKGDIIIRNSSLVFPPTQNVASEESALSVPIIVFDDTTKIGERELRSAADIYFAAKQGIGPVQPSKELEGATSFLDGLRYDLDIEAAGSSTDIRMIFNPLSSEELVATIDGKFSVTDDGRRWLGDLRVSRAYYNFYRRFDAEGRIRYTGDFMNPELDILATYRGSRTVRDSVLGDKNERVTVTVNITGTRTEPTLVMDMTIDGVDYNAYNGIKSNDVQSDAIGFIIYGSFPLSSAQKGEMSAEVEKTFRRSILTGASSLLTGTVSEFLRSQTGFISSLELDFNSQNGRSESADIRLSGQAWSGYWRYGGQILDDPLGNANFSVLYSFGTIFTAPSLRNLMMELESKVERGSFGQANDLRRTNSARVFYRFSF